MKKTLFNIGVILFVVLIILISLFLVSEIFFLIAHKKSYFKSTRLKQNFVSVKNRLMDWEFTDKGFLKAKEIDLINGSFEHSNGIQHGWVATHGTLSKSTDGYKSIHGNKIVTGSIRQNIPIPLEQIQGKNRPLIFSAWIRTDTPQNAYIMIEAPDLKQISKGFHSGSGQWEMISAVLPAIKTAQNINIILGVEKYTASFDLAKLILGRQQRISQDSNNPPLRFRELISSKKSGQFRILALGGSTTYGHTGFYESWPYLLEQKLNSYFPNKYEVINLGKPGLSTIDLLDYSIKNKNFKDGYLSLEPDMVIITPVWNDLLNDFALKENFTVINQRFRSNFFVKNTALGYYIYTFVYSRLINRLFDNFVKAYPDEETKFFESDEKTEKWVEFMSTGLNKSIPLLAFKIRLEKLLKLYQENNIEIYLLTRPCIWLNNSDTLETSQIMKSYNVLEANTSNNMIKAWLLMEELDRRIITQAGRNYNVNYDDFTAYFRKKYPSILDRAQYFQDGTHFNLKGSTLLADYIFNSENFQSIVAGL